MERLIFNAQSEGDRELFIEALGETGIDLSYECVNNWVSFKNVKAGIVLGLWDLLEGIVYDRGINGSFEIEQINQPRKEG